jgi:hypothetical protein
MSGAGKWQSRGGGTFCQRGVRVSGAAACAQRARLLVRGIEVVHKVFASWPALQGGGKGNWHVDGVRAAACGVQSDPPALRSC